MADAREVQHDPEVLSGDDDLLRQPGPLQDPYTPEPGPTQRTRRAFDTLRWALVPLLIGIAVVIWAAAR